jgi:hypothetical protein
MTIVLMIVPGSSTVSTILSGSATVSMIINLTKVQVLPLDSNFFRPNAANGNHVGGDGFFSRSSVLNSSLQNYHDDDHFTGPRRYDYHANQETGHGYVHHPSFLPLASCSDVHNKHASGCGLPPGQSFLPCSTVLTVKERDHFCSEVLGVRSRYRHLLDKSILTWDSYTRKASIASAWPHQFTDQSWNP